MLEMEDLGTRLSQLYSSIVTFWISIIPFFLVFEPRDLQIILSTNRYTTKNMFYSLLHNFIGDGLITNTGEKWKQHRRLIQPYFHVNILKVYFDAFYKSSVIIVQDLKNQEDVNITGYANRFVLDVLQGIVKRKIRPNKLI
jgi:cytochrome P450 family 4